MVGKEVMLYGRSIRGTIYRFRKPLALLGAVGLAVLFSAGVSLAHRASIGFLPDSPLFKPPTTTRLVTTTENVPFELRQVDDPSLASGQTTVQTNGVMGELSETFRVTYLNGQEIGRKLVHQSTLRGAVAQVVLVGTGATLASSTDISSTNVSQNNSSVSVDSTGSCSINTSGDLGDHSITTNNGSYNFTNTSTSGSSNNSISVNCNTK